jgi:putative FmdB family regulatory protein
MPTYDYKCDKCGHRFEKFQSFSESFLKVCPECGDETLRKVFSPSGIVFKGSGWYINDSRSKGGSKETKSDDSSKSSSDSTSESAA